MIKMVARAPAPTRHHVDDGASFGRGYRSILNSFSTIDPHHHVKYSRLNRNVKTVVEIDPSVG
jgi:hypothetical protein